MRRVLSLVYFILLALLYPVIYLLSSTFGNTNNTVWPQLAGWLVPLGVAAIVVGARAPEQSERISVSLALAAAATILCYWLCGFAFQFGGAGLLAGVDAPRLVAEWSPLDLVRGSGWGMVGLRGFMLSSAYGESALRLGLGQLPLIVTAVLIPLLAVGERMPRVARVSLVILMAGIIVPIAGNWVYGGGWLAHLGDTFGWGQGYTDFGMVSYLLLGVGATAAMFVLYGLRKRRLDEENLPPKLTPAQRPLIVLTGGLLIVLGWLTVVSEPVISSLAVSPSELLLKALLAAAAALLGGLVYGWLVRGRSDTLLAARALTAGWVITAAGLPYLSTGILLLLGGLAGFGLAPVCFVLEERWRLDDRASAFALYGVMGVIGLLGVGLLGTEHGMMGLVAAFDKPGQLWAQSVGVAALLVWGLGVPLVLFGIVRGAARWPGSIQAAYQATQVRAQGRHQEHSRRRQRGQAPTVAQRLYAAYLHSSAKSARHKMQRRSVR